MKLLDKVGLTAFMQRTNGRHEVNIGLIDGPVAVDHPDLADASIHVIPTGARSTCTLANSAACAHGTFVAGILCAKRGSAAPAICPGCTLLVRPIFAETTPVNGQLPSATPEELATAIVESIEAGAHVLNLSVALAQSFLGGHSKLQEALDYAALRRVIVVVAAGNQGDVGSSIITRHPWVIAVVACDLQGRPLRESNLGSSIGRRGLSAPGDRVTSLGADGPPRTAGGTSIAAPFVTGTVALLWSEFPSATAVEVKMALTQSHASRRRTVMPPLLNAWDAYQALAKTQLLVARK